MADVQQPTIPKLSPAQRRALLGSALARPATMTCLQRMGLAEMRDGYRVITAEGEKIREALRRAR